MEAAAFLEAIARRSSMSVTHADKGKPTFATHEGGLNVRAVADEKHRCLRLLCPLGTLRSVDDAFLAHRLLKLNAGAVNGEPYFSFVASSRVLYIGTDVPIGSATPEEVEQFMSSLASRAMLERERLSDVVLIIH